MCNLLESLRHILESPEYDDGMITTFPCINCKNVSLSFADINLVDPIGLIVIVSSMPNQTEVQLHHYDLN